MRGKIFDIQIAREDNSLSSAIMIIVLDTHTKYNNNSDDNNANIAVKSNNVPLTAVNFKYSIGGAHTQVPCPATLTSLMIHV